MSLHAVQAALARVKPRVWAVGKHLYARTSYPVQALTLFAYCRSLHVDGERQVVEFETLRGWAVRRHEEIPFAGIVYIDAQKKGFRTPSGKAGADPAQEDKLERYTVSLVLRNPVERLALFDFSSSRGIPGGDQGAVPGGVPEADAPGEPADSFVLFVGKLHEILGVPVGMAELPSEDGLSLKYQCTVCGRPSVPCRKHCWVCGSPVEPVIPGRTVTRGRPVTIGTAPAGPTGEAAVAADASLTGGQVDESNAGFVDGGRGGAATG